MRFDVITLFPGMFAGPLTESILARAREAGRIEVHLHNLRDWALGKHLAADDTPFGGGDGMVMKPEPLAASIRAIKQMAPSSPVVLLTPQGKTFDQARAAEMAALPGLILVCGHYAGVDERVIEKFVDMEVSIGDYVLSGGETAAAVVLEAVSRLLPGVLGNELSPEEDSFPERLEYPIYTRPAEFEGMAVPEVLLSGHHENIRRWRRKESLRRTRERRTDLFEKHPPDEEERKLLAEMDEEGERADESRERFRGGRLTAEIYMALLHHPVLDKSGRVINTAVTNMDLHDMARLSRTYGLAGFHVVQPLELQRRLVRRLIGYWKEGPGGDYNLTRKDAFEKVSVAKSLDEAIGEIEEECGARPAVVGTSARPGEGRSGYGEIAARMKKEGGPWLVLFGTGWGIEPGYLRETADFVLEPLRAGSSYNHLSVRTAAAVIIDRLAGED